MNYIKDDRFTEHNKRVRKLWEDFEKGVHERVPMITGVSDRFFVLNPVSNPENVSFYDYSNDPETMFRMQCEFAKYAAFEIVGDRERGVPENGWTLDVDFQNYYEAAWFGSEVRFIKDQVPYAMPLLKDDNREMLFEKGIPDPFSGFMAKAKSFYDYFVEQSNKTLIMGQRISHINPWATGTDGMFTVACELRGASNLCMDMMEDPDYYHELMQYLTDSIIARLKAWRKYIGEPEQTTSFGFADDMIMILSNDMYKEFVLPYHKQLAKALSTMEKRGGVHLCGDATRHFKTLRDELNIYSFDTGFPVDHRKMCLELGPEVSIQGGPSADLICCGTPEEIRKESKRILEEVKPVSRRFIFRDGNDIAPYTPMENIQALYDACLEYGYY